MVLCIANRTENWKTAYMFAPYFRDRDARLRLVKHLGETGDVNGSEIRFELFWKVTRDYIHGIEKAKRPQIKEALLGRVVKSL